MSETEGWLARVARRLGDFMGQADSAGSPAEERFYPPASGPREAAAGALVPEHPDIKLDANGRYVTGGYSFSTLEQALDHAARRSNQPSARVSAPPPMPRPSPISSSRGARQEPRWIEARTELVAGDRTFVADMVYFGTPLRHEPRHDKSRIDPTLAVDTRGDPYGATLDYWPSYTTLDPRARATYLDWLSGGRTDPAIPIGYVFLFFYGLEQRLLVDDARSEAPAIFAEVRRLLALHGENYSFSSYAAKLLALAAFHEDEEPPLGPACAYSYDFELPLDVRVRLGSRLRDGQPFDEEDALRWLLGLPDIYLRTPGQRCFEELRELWARRFSRRHPQGLSVRRPQRTLSHQYRAASGAFSVHLHVDDLPDITGTTAPLAQLRTMFEGCMEDLSAYSRLLGRESDAKGSLRADLLLPSDLRDDRPSLVATRTRLEAFAQKVDGCTVTAAEMARALDIAVEAGADKLPAAVARQIGLALDALDHGFEPDRRYGAGAALRPETPLLIFAHAGGCAVEPERPAYAAARTIVEIAMLAALCDGEVVPAELDTVERRLGTLPGLAPHELARLMACGRALAADPPKLRAALKRLSEVPATERETIAVSAVEAVLADGRVHPEEVRFLESLHGVLGISAATLYASLHRGGTGDQGPVLVFEGAEEGTVPIPPESRAGNIVSIDAARLARIRGETEQVSSLLASIFVEDEPAPAAPPPPPETAPSGFEGLDGPHAALLVRLLEGALERARFDAIARELRLMPEGAIETINDWGFDRFDALLIEDDDEICLAADIVPQLAPKGVAA